MIFSLCVNLGILAFFKYFNFFIDNFIGIFNFFGVSPDSPTINIILPVGISFYTFQTLSYTIDIYRGKLSPTKSFLDFALFVSFFPQLVAGPIERAKNLLPQIIAPRTIKYVQIREGLWLILFGYYKKVVIADNFAKIADSVFNNPDQYGGLVILLGTYAFAFQIYGDFSGYTDIARGTSKLFGIELKVNFRMPYFARNPQDFWRRWHISLSTWLRDYLYIPLGGSRKGTLKTYRNLNLTMILGGLWHGAAWNFICWGIYHGLLLSLHRILATNYSKIVSIKIKPHYIVHFFKIILMFHLTCFGWMIFRVNNFSDLIILTTNLFKFKLVPINFVLPALFLLLPVLALHFLQEKTQNLMVIKEFNRGFRLANYTLIYGLILIFGVVDNYEFIYFQF
jgi:D-alanyl-lipoteichoic acid acyltransferase DltB (MBOAT superfamily)